MTPEQICTIICAMISSASAIVVAVIGASNRRSQKRAEYHAKLREDESRLSMKMLDAAVQLSIVSANALTGGHNNGNVEEARAASESARKEYISFLQKTTSHEIS